jgi:hypothetical protein
LLGACTPYNTAQGEKAGKCQKKFSSAEVFQQEVQSKRHKLFHGKSIGKKRAARQPLAFSLVLQTRYFIGASRAVNINSPNASGTWKFGTRVPVGRHAE